MPFKMNNRGSSKLGALLLIVSIFILLIYGFGKQASIFAPGSESASLTRISESDEYYTYRHTFTGNSDNSPYGEPSQEIGFGFQIPAQMNIPDNVQTSTSFDAYKIEINGLKAYSNYNSDNRKQESFKFTKLKSSCAVYKSSEVGGDDRLSCKYEGTIKADSGAAIQILGIDGGYAEVNLYKKGFTPVQVLDTSVNTIPETTGGITGSATASLTTSEVAAQGYPTTNAPSGESLGIFTKINQFISGIFQWISNLF